MTETQLIPLLFILATVLSTWVMVMISTNRNTRRHRELMQQLILLEVRIEGIK